MHVSSNGDPVEITGERDSLAISCDLFTHAVNMLMSMCKRDNCVHSIHCENSDCRGGRLSGHRNWCMYLLICV
jgi:hypothetical protein